MISKSIDWSLEDRQGNPPPGRWAEGAGKEALIQICDGLRMGCRSGPLTIYLADHPTTGALLGGRNRSMIKFSLSLDGGSDDDIQEFHGNWEVRRPPSPQMIDDLIRYVSISSLSPEIGPREDGSIGELFKGPKHEMLVERARELIDRHALRQWKYSTDPEPHTVDKKHDAGTRLKSGDSPERPALGDTDS